jgi:hypothetical protein
MYRPVGGFSRTTRSQGGLGVGISEPHGLPPSRAAPRRARVYHACGAYQAISESSAAFMSSRSMTSESPTGTGTGRLDALFYRSSC